MLVQMSAETSPAAMPEASDNVASIAARLTADRSKRAAEIPFRQGRYAFDHNPNPMLLLEAATRRYVGVNQAAIDLYGYTREEFLTKGPSDLRGGSAVAGLEAALDRFKRKVSNTIDTVHVRADGSRLDAHLSIVTVAEGGEQVHIVTVEDMTDRNEALAHALR